MREALEKEENIVKRSTKRCEDYHPSEGMHSEGTGGSQERIEETKKILQRHSYRGE